MNITKTTIITILAVTVANFASVEGELQRNGRVRTLEKNGGVRKMKSLKAAKKSPKDKTDGSRSSSDDPKPIGVIVHVEIQPDRKEEFLVVIKEDAVGSRKEPGCIRFDVLQSLVDSNKYVFYEVYEDLDAITYHNKQPHYANFTEFYLSGGFVDINSVTTSGIFMSE